MPALAAMPTTSFLPGFTRRRLWGWRVTLSAGLMRVRFHFLAGLHREFLFVVEELHLVSGEGDFENILGTCAEGSGKDGDGAEEAENRLHVWDEWRGVWWLGWVSRHCKIRAARRNGRFAGKFEKLLKIAWSLS